jgi:hypothetical protein
MPPDRTIDQNPSLENNARVTGDVFTGGKREINTAGGDYFESIQNYHERRRPPVPRQAPAPPRYFVPRSDLTQPLVSALSAASQVVALTGQNGVGKTTLACAVSTETQAHFAEGLLWGEFHDRADEAREVLGDFLAALDVDLDEFRSLDQRVRMLRSVLAGRRLLLVLDNWPGGELDPYELLPANGASGILITTPNQDEAARAASQVVDVPPMAEVAARELLGKVAGPALSELPEPALGRMLDQTGGFPVLLVTLAQQARQVRRQGVEALQAWASNPNIQWDDLASLYAFAFSRLAPVEQQALQALAQLAAAPVGAGLVAAALGLEAEAARDCLRGLEARSLVETAPGGAYWLPAPIHGFARRRLGSAPEAANTRRRLVAYWRARAEESESLAGEAHLPAHARALFEQCLQAEEWSSVRALALLQPRPAQISRGSLSSLYGADLFLSQFNDVTCGQSVLANAELSGAQWNGCDYNRATLAMVALAGSQFNDCNFSVTRWVGADLRAAQFNGCNFSDFHLVNVDLRGAEFNGCRFDRSQWVNVRLQDTAFSGCSGLEFLASTEPSPPDPASTAR